MVLSLAEIIEHRLQQNHWLPSGKQPHNYGQSPFFIGKSTINGPFSVANCKRLPEGNRRPHVRQTQCMMIFAVHRVSLPR